MFDDFVKFLQTHIHNIIGSPAEGTVLANLEISNRWRILFLATLLVPFCLTFGKALMDSIPKESKDADNDSNPNGSPKL